MTIASLRTAVIMLCASRKMTEDAKDYLLDEIDAIVGREPRVDTPVAVAKRLMGMRP